MTPVTVTQRVLTQISKREGVLERVPPGESPVLELHLEAHQYVASVEMRPVVLFASERKTVDWRWTAYVVTPLPHEERLA